MLAYTTNLYGAAYQFALSPTAVKLSWCRIGKVSKVFGYCKLPSARNLMQPLTYVDHASSVNARVRAHDALDALA